MRHGTTTRRSRKRSNGGGRRGNQNRAKVYDSNGPDVRIRGTAHQVTEKYLALAKDAASSGNRVLAESYLQHAEHYQRIVNSFTKDVQPEKPQVDAVKDVPEKDTVSAKSESDLSLPASILGDPADVETEAVSA